MIEQSSKLPRTSLDVRGVLFLFLWDYLPSSAVISASPSVKLASPPERVRR